jgi:hypothetical protein
LGNSGWEFGTNRDIAKKAEEDYVARTKGVDATVRKDTSFVFVTPRNWTGKEAWAVEKRATGEWKHVAAHDAGDLEQWLEVSIPAQAWMAEQLGIGASDVQSLDACWKRWAGVTNPEFSRELFRSASQAHIGKLVRWLEKPAEFPLTVVADSTDEALAALACLFKDELVAKLNVADRVVVVKSADALSKIASASTDFIVVMAAADAERESAGVHREHHALIITRRNAIEGEADIIFDLVDHETFRVGLTVMQFNGDGIERLARESGYSLTVLRRRLSQIPEIRTPPWATHQGIADRLIPLAFVGAWDSTSGADQAILADIAAGSHDEVEMRVAELGIEDQSPIWSIGQFRGVVSKVDAFYAVRSYVTPAHLKRFFQVARVVLSESDPALELPEDKRWASNLYGKSRRHSAALRQGLCETLVLLSVHGNNLFKMRLGFDVEGNVNDLIRKLLTPLDPVTWQSQQRDLPRYAEAAPEVFLDILDQDLQSDDPKVHALMQPVDAGGFSSPGRTGLLWALEVLAWNPQWLPRVVVILGKLAELKINDNWTNKPEKSLSSIFRCWMPQTAATIDERIAALVLLIRRSPQLGWQICIEQFDRRSTIGDFTSRPNWRRDALGAGQGATGPERYKMARKALDLAIGWPVHNDRTLGDLVERLDGIPPPDQEAIWSIIEKWAVEASDEACKAVLRERIRKSTLTLRSRVREPERKLRTRAKGVYNALEPSDVVARHQWLFAKQWVEESADELSKGDIDFSKRDERIARIREAALREIWSELGYNGIVRMSLFSEAPGIIGWHLASGVFDARAVERFVSQVISDGTDASRQSMDRCLFGLLGRLDPQVRRGVLSGIVEKRLMNQVPKAEVARLLKCAPFGSETWYFVDLLPTDEKVLYWRDISPGYFFAESAEDIHRVVDELLAVDRPRAAFNTVEMVFAKIASPRLVRLLFETATNRSEPDGLYRLASHHISDAFKELTKRQDVMPDELARLEFLYIDALNHTQHGIPNLEMQLAQSPELFVQALAYAFKRNDGEQDPPQLRPSNTDSTEGMASASYALLSRAKQIPGTNEKGEIDARKLRDWLTRVRELTREYAREVVGDSIVGQILGRSPKGEDGIWPSEVIREVLEDFGTSELANGMSVGLYNSRGAGWRGEGGAQERGLAEAYQAWSRQLASQYPFTSRMLNDIAKMYGREAEWHDTDSMVRKRLQD